jgi:Lrp/AsnC family leucine-responsive transcriptional regulator
MLDEKDWQIIEELQKDSRQSTADISRKTRIPRVTVHDRIQKMKKFGAISRFTVALDGKKIGKPTIAFVMVKSLPNQQADQHKVASDIARISDVMEAYTLAGEWDLLVKIRAKSIEDAGSVVVSRIRQVKGVERTLTLATFSELKSI